MPKKTRSQVIWYRELDGDHDDLELRIPKIINTDIGFQLMFGVSPDYVQDEIKTQKHHDNYSIDVKESTYESIKQLYK